jgi:hypothetical protein
MLKTKSVTGPGLSAGQFSIGFGEFEAIKTDFVTSKLTANASGGAVHVFVPVSDVGLYAIGDTITIADALASETNVISNINTGTGDLTVTALSNTYTVANGAYVGFPATPAPRVKVDVDQPFTGATLLSVGWSVSGTTITVTVKKSTGAGGISWGNAVNADVAAVTFSVTVDGE